MGQNLKCMKNIMNRMGQLKIVKYNGEDIQCLSSCEDQINSIFVSSSSYPNKRTFIYHEEFCILVKRILEKCKGPKKKPLERQYPNICNMIEPLKDLDLSRSCRVIIFL